MVNIKGAQNKQVYFVYLMGSHWNYEDRYPKEFEVFKIQNSNVDKYLNTVYYNNWVVGKLIGIGKKNGIDLVCYFSDHGEDLKTQHNQENYTREMSR